ncbi:MAG TPA: OmpH family outer membrane protein [Allosphingosinicella sp.]|jgi:Skp family chaperone for outer membrane proteins
MNKYTFGAAMAALALAIPAAAPAQKTPGAAIVVVDIERVYQECTACRAANTQLQTQLQQIQQRAQQLAQPIQTEGTAIETAIRALNGKQPDAALQARITALQTKQNQGNQEIQGREQTLRSTQANVAQQINARLNPIINQVMTARGANLALDVNSTLARAQALDVTNDVLAQLNQQLPSVTVAPLPQGQQPARPQGR